MHVNLATQPSFAQKHPRLNNIRKWGWKGAFEAGKTGVFEGLGFYRTQGPGSPFSFLGSTNPRGVAKGMLFGLGVGYAAYKATDNPLIGAGVGMATAKLMGTPIMRALNPAFAAFAAFEGFREGGLGGMFKSTLTYAAGWGLWELGTSAIGTAFKGTGMGAAGMFTRLLTPAAIGVGVVIGGYKAAQYLAERGRRSVLPEFAGNMAAFQTDAAYTMRQRALQEITRSHTNSRTILGNEASLMHI